MIRPATNIDVVEITGLVFSVLQEYGLEPDPDSTDADLKDIEFSYTSKGGSFSVYESHEGSILGTVGIFPISVTECELRKMYVRPEVRGNGIGKQLMEHSVKKAGELGFESMILETAAVLKEAIGLYRKYGFEPIELDHLSARCDQAFRKQIK